MFKRAIFAAFVLGASVVSFEVGVGGAVEVKGAPEAEACNPAEQSDPCACNCCYACEYWGALCRGCS